MEENIEVIEKDQNLGLSFLFVDDLFKRVEEIEKQSNCKVEVKVRARHKG